MSNKIYCGSGKAFGQYNGVNLGICLDDIPQEFFKKASNGKVYLNLVLNQKREVDQYGKTHSIEVDTFVPNQQSNQPNQAPQQGYQQQAPSYQAPAQPQTGYYTPAGGSNLDGQNSVNPAPVPTDPTDNKDGTPF